MQPFNALRTLALGSMLAVSIMSPLAPHVHAEPRAGGSGTDTRPDNATCVFVTAGFYDCTTPDGGEWYCTNDTDPTACVNITPPPNPSRVGSSSGSGIVHPVIGGIFDPGSSSLSLAQVALNPQPIPPGLPSLAQVALNPQPIPPGLGGLPLNRIQPTP